jgi:uncharacterized membrane protein
MNCEEFLRVYRETLDGKVSEQDISDNVNYYRSYINREVRKGKSEEEVIRSLGDPRLLAKTLEESIKFASSAEDGSYRETGDFGRYEDVGDNSNKGVHIKQLKLPSWLVGIIVAIVVIFIIAIVFKVAFFLAPYIIAFLIVGFIIREIMNWINRY